MEKKGLLCGGGPACPRPLSAPLLGWGRSQASLPPGCPHQPCGDGRETQVSEAGPAHRPSFAAALGVPLGLDVLLRVVLVCSTIGTNPACLHCMGVRQGQVLFLSSVGLGGWGEEISKKGEDRDATQNGLEKNEVMQFANLSILLKRVSEFDCHISGCCQVFDTLEDYEHHYNTLHRNVCSFCKRSFPSGQLLDIHILEWHDSLFQIMAEKQSMYKCLVEGCVEKFKSSKDRKDHLVAVHLYPADFRFDRPKKLKSGPKHVSSPTKQGASVPMDVSMEVLERCQVDPMETGPCEDMEILQPTASPGPLVPEKRLYKSRIPSTICFGQGATRGFKGPRKKV